MERCTWANNDPLMKVYQDNEWGVPLYDERKQFEFLSMEVMQCGLSWLTVLRKRTILGAAFADFDPATVARYQEKDIAAIMAMEGMIRSPRKIRAIIQNAKAFLDIQTEFGSFTTFLWNYTNHQTLEYPGHADGSVVIAKNELSEQISKDLKIRGFSYLGPITVYSHLQAAGLINDHYHYCFRYHQLKPKN